ncbi:hypothetical protein ACSFB8_08400 [Enterococcus faecalis]
MKKIFSINTVLLLVVSFLGFFIINLNTTVSQAETTDSVNSAISVGGIATDKYAPTGDPSISYPQISIRTNRTPQRTDLASIENQADKIANKFPKGDSADRSKAVIKYLNDQFGGGGFGHTWIIIFHSSKENDYTSYAYHEGYGFVKDDKVDGQSIPSLNDHSTRGFNQSKTIPLPAGVTEENLEKNYIPSLNQISEQMGAVMGIPYKKGHGAYTPISNCTWFAGQLWNYVTNENMVYSQTFDGAAHADVWGMPFLTTITDVSDPGMFSESINSQKVCDTNGNPLNPASHYRIKVDISDGSPLANIPYYFYEKRYGLSQWTYLTQTQSNANAYSINCSEASEGVGYKIHDDATNGYLVRQKSNLIYRHGGLYTKTEANSGDLFSLNKVSSDGKYIYQVNVNTGGITADPENTSAIISNGKGHTFNIEFEKIN